MEKYVIEFYERENGEEPAKDFITSLNAKMKAKIFRVLDLLEENGPAVRMPIQNTLKMEYLKYAQNRGQT